MFNNIRNNKKISTAILCIVLGIYFFARYAGSYIIISTGDYDKVPAAVVDYDKHRRRRRNYYIKIYEYKENGKAMQYTGKERSQYPPTIGKKTFLYHNRKTGEYKEALDSEGIFLGILFMSAAIIVLIIPERYLPEKLRSDT